MAEKRNTKPNLPHGLFITGTDTGVGKTVVAARIAADLRRAGKTVGVYKPVASGCRRSGKTLLSDDAVALWEAAGRPGELKQVCPQRFAAPLAPHLAARAEGREVNAKKLRTGLTYWLERSDFVVVEGAGGLMSPLTDDDYNADLAAEFAFPLIVVAPDRLGTINQTLQTLISAAAFGEGLSVAGVILNEVTAADEEDLSRQSNEDELRRRCVPPILTRLRFNAERFTDRIDWTKLAGVSRSTVAAEL